MSNNCIEHEVGKFSINQWVGLKDDECTVNTNERESAAPGEYILGNFDINESLVPHIEALEVRFTTRANMVQKKDGITGWVDGGFSIGYEF